MVKKKESDSAYLLKLLLYLLLGSLWLKVTPASSTQIPIPVGFIIGLIFATHEHFQIDRKIEYAVLLIAAAAGFLLPFGVYLYL